MPKLRFRYDYHVEVLDETVFLLSEYRHHTLNGRLYALIAPLLNGDHTIDEVIQALSPYSISPAQVHYIVSRLQNAGHLISVDESLPPSQSAFWTLQGIQQPQRKSAVSLYHYGVETNEFENTFNQFQITPEANFALVLVDDYLNPALVEFNRQARAAQRSWMLVKPIGAVLWIGPIFTPESACWACLEQRLTLNRSIETFLQQKKDPASPINLSYAALPSTIQTALSLAATEAERYLNGHTGLKDYVVTFDTLTLSTTHHKLVKRSQCPVCGNAISVSTAPIELQSHKKASNLDSGHRSMSSEETYNRYRHHVSMVTGVVSRLERVAGTEMVYIYDAGPNKSRPFEQWKRMRSSLRSSAAGKGTDDLQARVSGLCEALERYSGVFQGDEPRIAATYEDIQAKAIHPSSYLLYSEDQYQNRESWNAVCPPHLQITQPFDSTRPVEWSKVWSLSENRFKYLPTAYCYYHYPLPDDHRFCIPDSNGNAAGSSLEDAILQGFMELVERDSVAIWWYNRVRRPGVDLDSLNNPYIDSMRRYYASIQREFWVLDLTTDLEIPSFVALSRRTDKPAEDIIMGFGAHFDAKIAVMRALTELNQMLPSVLTIGADGTGTYYTQSKWEIEWWEKATLQSEPYLVPHQPLKQLSDYPVYTFDDLRDEVLHCVEVAGKQSMEVLVLDQTRPDVGLPVVKVIVPGLRHFWARFAPGRLYDVPVKLGWLKHATLENQLNPWYMTL